MLRGFWNKNISVVRTFKSLGKNDHYIGEECVWNEHPSLHRQISQDSPSKRRPFFHTTSPEPISNCAKCFCSLSHPSTLAIVVVEIDLNYTEEMNGTKISKHFHPSTGPFVLPSCRRGKKLSSLLLWSSSSLSVSPWFEELEDTPAPTGNKCSKITQLHTPDPGDAHPSF